MFDSPPILNEARIKLLNIKINLYISQVLSFKYLKVQSFYGREHQEVLQPG